MILDADAIRRVFAENFASRGEIGASVSIWQDGREVLTLADGFCERDRARPWTADTPALIWSATKGLAAACVLHALDTAGVGLETPVAELWPEFAQAGKAHISIAEVLSHRAGLAALDENVSVLDYAGVTRALAEQAPLWPRGTGHGYHTRTFGYLADEILRRVQPAGMTLGRYWREQFAAPQGFDAWIGLPEAEQARVATTYAARVSANNVTAPDPLYRALADPASLSRRSFSSPGGLSSVASMNAPEARRGIAVERRHRQRAGAGRILRAPGGGWSDRRHDHPADQRPGFSCFAQTPPSRRDSCWMSATPRGERPGRCSGRRGRLLAIRARAECMPSPIRKMASPLPTS